MNSALAVRVTPISIDADHAHEERADRGVDGHVQSPVVVGVLLGRDGDPAADRIAVLVGLLVRERVGLGGLVRQHHRAGQGRGVGRALHAEGVDPVPRHVDDERDHHHEQQERAREDDDDLASAAGARPVAIGGRSGRSGHVGPRRSGGRSGGHRATCRQSGFRDMTVRSVMCSWGVPAAPMRLPSGVTKS